MYRALIAEFRKFRRDQRGSVLVEMTLITPLMIALSAGVFEFGNLIHRKLLIEAGLRDGARYAARCNPQLFSDAGLAINCATNARNIALFGNTAGTGSARVYGWSAGDITVNLNHLVLPAVGEDGTVNYLSTTANVRVVRVSTSYSYEGTSLLSYLGLSPIALTAAQEERYIGW